MLEADPGFEAPRVETREVYGMRLTQPRDDVPITRDLLAGRGLEPQVVDDLVLGLTVVRFTQSNSVAYVSEGMVLGVGAGQQSRVDCTRLAGAKGDTWALRRRVTVPVEGRVQERVQAQLCAVDELADRSTGLDAVAFVSDAALVFADNVEEAARHGVRYVAEPGDSVADECRRRGIAHVATGLRLFRH